MYIEMDADTLEQREADEHMAYEAAAEWDAFINSAECQNSPAYAAGYAKAVADRREQDRKATEQLIRNCTRKPDPSMHFSILKQEAF